MKLLFDENLSPKLVRDLTATFPGSAHVRDVGLLAASDDAIWQLARRDGLLIVSKDTDFLERSYVEGSPPWVIWLQVGNAGTESIAALLQRQQMRIESFARSTESSVLILTLSHD